MDDLKKSLRDKASRVEKEGTPLRGLLASSRLFIEETYKTTVATFSPVKAQNLYAERVNLASKSFNAFKHNNQVSKLLMKLIATLKCLACFCCMLVQCFLYFLHLLLSCTHNMYIMHRGLWITVVCTLLQSSAQPLPLLPFPLCLVSQKPISSCFEPLHGMTTIKYLVASGRHHCYFTFLLSHIRKHITSRKASTSSSLSMMHHFSFFTNPSSIFTSSVSVPYGSVCLCWCRCSVLGRNRSPLNGYLLLTWHQQEERRLFRVRQ